MSQKGCHPNYGYNFVNSRSIFKLLFAATKSTKFPTKLILGSPTCLKYVAALPRKLKNQKFALCMHVKHVSSVTFYRLSNRYLSNVMKISAKINTMQNNNMLHSVNLCTYFHDICQISVGQMTKSHT